MSFTDKIGYAIETLREVAKDAADGKPLVLSDEEAAARIAICESCEHFAKKLRMCRECGCFMKAKTALSSTRCPLNKWAKSSK